MRLPDWIPKVTKPFDDGYHDAWEAMTDDEKRWSFVIDLITVAFGVFIMYLIFSIQHKVN